MTRFFVLPEEMQSEFFVLTGENAQHAKVLRLKNGEEVLVCDGEGRECLCTISDVSPGQISLVVKKRRESESEAAVQVSVYMAFPKADKLEHVIQKATELGAYEIIAFPSARCVSRPDEKSLKKKLERWQKIAASAAELSVGVAEAMDIETGDTVTLRSADMEVMELTVSGIYDNHVYNYCIVSPEAIQKQWHRTPEQQMALIQTDGDVHALAGHITELSNVMNVAVSDDLAEMVGGMMDALDLVVWVIVFCAGLLAVIVLYNLTNININERIREIATIKVLGFNAAETGAYVFKENLVLTVAGSIFGLGLGYLMLVFVMTQIKIDMVWFKPLIMGRSYLISIALTILSAIVVDFIFYFKLDKINMAEALKSVE